MSMSFSFLLAAIMCAYLNSSSIRFLFDMILSERNKGVRYQIGGFLLEKYCDIIVLLNNLNNEFPTFGNGRSLVMHFLQWLPILPSQIVSLCLRSPFPPPRGHIAPPMCIVNMIGMRADFAASTSHPSIILECIMDGFFDFKKPEIVFIMFGCVLSGFIYNLL